MSQRSEHSEKLTQEQKDLIERFLVAYTHIEGALRHKLGEGTEISISQLIKQYGKDRPNWRDTDGKQLRVYSSLRDALVHTERKPHEYLSVPLPYVVDRIEEININLTNPKKVHPEFQRDVVSVALSTPIFTVLGYIREKEFSQFPVYNNENTEFLGLLTENGLTRWLAGYVADSTIVCFEDVFVHSALSNEESRENYRFASRNTQISTVVDWFTKNPLVEAVIITNDGKKEEKPLGIATRWDIVSYLR